MWSCSPPAPEKLSIVVRLWVPMTQRFVARKRNAASSGRLRIASIVSKRLARSTPLAAAVPGVVVLMGPTVRPRRAFGLGEDLEDSWRTAFADGPSWSGDLRVRGLRARHGALRAAPGGPAPSCRTAGLRRPAVPDRARGPGGGEGGAARQRLGRPLRE